MEMGFVKQNGVGCGKF